MYVLLFLTASHYLEKKNHSDNLPKRKEKRGQLQITYTE